VSTWLPYFTKIYNCPFQERSSEIMLNLRDFFCIARELCREFLHLDIGQAET